MRLVDNNGIVLERVDVATTTYYLLVVKIQGTRNVQVPAAGNDVRRIARELWESLPDKLQDLMGDEQTELLGTMIREGDVWSSAH